MWRTLFPYDPSHHMAHPNHMRPPSHHETLFPWMSVMSETTLALRPSSWKPEVMVPLLASRVTSDVPLILRGGRRGSSSRKSRSGGSIMHGVCV